MNREAEIRLPRLTEYHYNGYQQNGSFAWLDSCLTCGDSVFGSSLEDMVGSNLAGLIHVTIDDFVPVVDNRNTPDLPGDDIVVQNPIPPAWVSSLQSNIVR